MTSQEESQRREAKNTEDVEAAFRRVFARKLSERGFSGADLGREVEGLLRRAKTMRLVKDRARFGP